MMKKLMSILLVLAMILALAPMAFASEEAVVDAAEEVVIDEPVSEPAEEVTEEPAEEEPAEEPVIEEPAEDGLKVFGKYNVSQFAEETPLQLTDYTTLTVDCDKTLAGISGSETLYISLREGCTLTVNKPDGHGISVSTLYVSGHGTLVVNAGKDALNADVQIDLRNTNVVLNAGGDGIYCGDDIYIMDSSVEVDAEEDAVDLLGYLNIEGSDCTLTGGEYGVHSRAGRVTFTGSAIRASGSAAGIYIPIGFLESDGALRVRSTNTSAAYENYAIYTQGNIILKNGPVDVRGDFGGICSREGYLLSVYCDMDIRAGYATGILVPAGNVSLVGGNIVVQGNVRGTNSGIYANAGIHAQGIGIGDGANVEAKGSTALSASNYINIGAPTAASGADWGLKVWSSNPSGHTREINISDICRASGKNSAIMVNEGTISILPAYDIKVPQNGRIGTYQQVNTGILTSNGYVATEVEIRRYEPLVITSAAVTDMGTPAAGRPGETSLSVPDGAPYTVESVEWLVRNGDSWERLSGNWTFEKGKTYEYIIELAAKEDYVFAEHTTTTVDGVSCYSITLDDPSGLVIMSSEITIPCDVIPEARLVNLTPPADGETPKADAVVYPDAGFTIAQQSWCSDIDPDVRVSGSFKNGEYYWYSALLVPKEGYAFPDTYSGEAGTLYRSQFDLTVNGKEPYRMIRYYEAIPEVGIPEGALRVYIGFYATGETYGEDIDITDLAMPREGASGISNAKVSSSTVTVEQVWNGFVDGEYVPVDAFQAGTTYVWTCDLTLGGRTVFEQKSNSDYAGTITVNGEVIPRIDSIWGLLAFGDAAAKGEAFSGYVYQGVNGLRILLVRKALAKPKLDIASDGRSAQVTGSTDGLYARVALVLDNGGVSGLYVTQATINADGTVVIPAFTVPGLRVKGVNVALVPTLADIQSSTPKAEAMTTKMLT